METIRTYKLLRHDEEGLHPLFIDKYQYLPMGRWIDAKAPSELTLSYEPEGYSLIHLYHQIVADRRDTKPTFKEVSSVRFARWVEIRKDKRGRRRYYDIGIGSDGQVLRFAHRPGWHSSATPSLPAVDMTGKVWAECLIPADDYYTVHRNVSGLSRTHEPIDWYISQKIFIVRLVDSPQTNHVESAT